MNSIHEVIASMGTIVTIIATLFGGTFATIKLVKKSKEKKHKSSLKNQSPIKCYLVHSKATISDNTFIDYDLKFRLTNPSETTVTIIEALLLYNPGFLGKNNSARARKTIDDADPHFPVTIDASSAVFIHLYPRVMISDLGRAHLDRFNCILRDHLNRVITQRVTGVSFDEDTHT